jgi:hypothetical protein
MLSGQKAARNAEEIADLTASFSSLVRMLERPLQNAESWSPDSELRQRVENLSRLLLICLYVDED